ncbi:C2 calcium-dependent domain-containing protein 4C-like [Hyperolius riggenbachi]|uniref:C2 calcium-dependent domain-containing protein 4C-like n=1 Tax=Hyperolius riggenbachi TaxID=752182 RepID=UPI0035A36B14
MFCSKKKLLPSCPNILTPDQIPAFFIPPKLSSLPEGGGHVGRWVQRKTSQARSNSTSQTLLTSGSRHVTQVEDTEKGLQSPGQKKASDMASTIMGAPYLSESPHTRRRESLFHQMGPSSHGPCELRPISLTETDCVLTWKTSSQDLRYGLGLLNSDMTSSTESSPYSSPMLNRALHGSLANQVSTKQQHLSRNLSVKSLTRASSLSTEETSSADTSPNMPTKQDHPRYSMVHLVPPPILHLDFICCQDHLAKVTEVTLSKGGLIRLSVEYMKELDRLRVKLVNAENLYPSSLDAKTISCCVVMSLMPGKLQKQRSSTIRWSRNPIFNEDFFFEGLERGELEQLSLKLKVINKGTGVKRDIVLGRSESKLSSIL